MLCVIQRVMNHYRLALLLSGLLGSTSVLATDGFVEDSLRLIEDRMGAKCELVRTAGELQAPKICSVVGNTCRGTDTYRCVDSAGASIATVKARFIYRNDQVFKLHKLTIQMD